MTNPDTAIQGFVVRYISATSNGTVRAAGDEIGPDYLAAGESKRFTNLVPAGFRGLLEFDGALHAAVQRRSHDAQPERLEGRRSGQSR